MRGSIYLSMRHLPGICLLFFQLLYSVILCAQQVTEVHSIHLKKEIDLDLRLPPGFDISVASEGMDRLRFLAKSPDDRLFGTDMHDKEDNFKGVIYLFEAWDEAGKQFKDRIVFASGLHNPNQVAFYRDGDKDFIYIAETDKLSRYEYRKGDRELRGKPQVLARFPDYGLSYKYGGWHLTRSLAFNAGKLYVSVGSSCNACIEKEMVRASILEMNPDGTQSRIFASGLRNSVGMKWVDGSLMVTSMGRDLIGPDKPEDLFQAVEKGKFYGWPYYYQYKGVVYPDKQMQDSAKAQGLAIPPKPPVAYCGFKAHSAPLGLDHFRGFSDPLLKDRFLVALHGSTSVWRQRGNAIVAITGKNKYVEVVSGFLQGKEEDGRKGRPCDVMLNDDRSFLFTDDQNGVLYYVWKR
jgi:glucose/arabinose dehydrogenase